jgi:hypothetical protein
MVVPPLTDQILEEILYRGPMSVEELSEALKRPTADIQSALASMYRNEKEPQLIEYKDRKIARASGVG